MRRAYRWYAGGAAAAVLVLLWPGPSVSADTSLGGYEGVAEAAVVHFEVYEPVIPVPGSPQGDLSVGYTKSNVDSGPTSRALSSYLWPGVTVGDGFEQLTQHPGTKYPVQVNSRYPATSDAPAHNTIQISDGNGMTTSTDGMTTTSAVTLVGMGEPGTSPLGGLLSGAGQLSGKSTASAPAAPQLPVPEGPGLAALVTAKHVTSTSRVVVADKTVTSTGHAAVDELDLLGGMIKIYGLSVDSTVVSDGSKATPSADATIGGISVLGSKLAVDDKGSLVNLGVVSTTVSALLKTLGISFATTPVDTSASGASAEVSSKALTISIDTKPLKSVLDGVLNPLVASIPQQARDQLQPILDLGPLFVITVGSASASAGASPAYNPGSFGGGGSGSGGSGGNTGGAAVAAASAGGGGGSGGDTTPMSPGTPGGAGAAAAPGVQGAPLRPAAFGSLPPLGDVPRMLILGGLVLAAALGWAVRRAGGFLLGGTANCDYGLTTGVPDLRKG